MANDDRPQMPAGRDFTPRPTYPCARCGEPIGYGYPICASCSWDHRLQPWEQVAPRRRGAVAATKATWAGTGRGPRAALAVLAGLLLVAGVVAAATQKPDDDPSRGGEYETSGVTCAAHVTDGPRLIVARGSITNTGAAPHRYRVQIVALGDHRSLVGTVDVPTVPPGKTRAFTIDGRPDSWDGDCQVNFVGVDR